MAHPEEAQDSEFSRRAVLRGAAMGGVALPLLAACGGSSDSGSSGDGSVSIKTSEVPVGGGTILKADEVVVTQPTKGDFKAFTAICTHLGCTVGSIVNGQIVCPCHKSHYSITDGSVLSGPAPAPLAPKTVSVKGGQISVS